ncbi:endonuclease domain-containing protein [Streptomyces sp. AD55]|uniref:endonuclease domain-containing protein n=1 Tax=Streptomyces sp. AD55 TaxID=3242895 RepID=UPI0035294272
MTDERSVRRRVRCGRPVPHAAPAGGPWGSFRVPAQEVDHRRDAGRVRGVPCSSHDAELGQFKDRPDLGRRAAAHVEGIAWKPTLVAPGVYQLPS